jgi:A-factor biosynthesis hotdog domain
MSVVFVHARGAPRGHCYDLVVPNAQSAIKPDQRSQLPSTPETAWLRFDRNVARELVHRRALAEVLIADTVQVAEDEFLLGTQLPRAHTLWSDRRYPYHDPLITVEICRQACIATLQRYYHVGPDWQLISKQIDLRVFNLDAYTDREDAPPEAILRARISNKQLRRGVLHEITIDSELSIDGVPGGTVTADVVVLPRKTFDRLRAQQLRHKLLDDSPPARVQPLDSADVGRIFDQNVAIGECDPSERSAPGECRYRAIVNQMHPCFFDHPLDHVPGALVMEIYRQAAIATATRANAGTASTAIVTRCDVQFSDFAELQAGVECSASAIDEPQDERVQIASTLHQLDKQIGEGRIELRFLPPAAQR